MRYLEGNEIEEWGRGSGIPLDTGHLGADLRFTQRMAYANGKRSGKEPAIAAKLVAAFAPWQECLLWIRGWGVWPSGEDWPAYYALRGHDGERRSLDKAPGHLFVHSESDRLVTFLAQVLRNAWDADLIAVGPEGAVAAIVQISHDEWLEVRSPLPLSLSLDPV